MRNLLILSLFVSVTGCQFDVNGLNPVDGGPDAGPHAKPLAVNCMSDKDCDDGVACTSEICQEDTHTCLRVADSGQCKPGEVCVIGTHVGEGGCQAPAPMCPTSCEDGIACTIDSCDSSFVCQHLPDSSKCPAGQVCDVMKGCVSPAPPPMCPASCDDGVACTVDSCGVDLMCHHLPDSSKCPMGQTCTASGCAAPPPHAHTIDCSVSGPDMTITVNGPIQDALVGGTVVNPGYLEYGSDTDGWSVPYSMGKPSRPWTADNATYVLTVSSAMNGFNLFLSDNAFIGGKWFDDTKWTATGACHWVSTKIYH